MNARGYYHEIAPEVLCDEYGEEQADTREVPEVGPVGGGGEG